MRSAPDNFEISDVDLLRRSAFFDSAFYLSRNPDVAASQANPLKHYLDCGAQEGRDPSPEFSTSGYLALYPDVGIAGINPLVHFLRNGLSEGRDTGVDIDLLQPKVSAPITAISATNDDRALVMESGLFDAQYYLAQYEDVVASGIDPLTHYLEAGAREKRDPSESFSTSGYLRRHQDVAALNLNPLLHYLRHGRQEGRTVVRATPLIPSLSDLCEQHWPALAPLPAFTVPATRLRLNIVTDSVGASSLFGGVGTALILATLLANRLQASLRVVTRTEAPDARILNNVLTPNGLKLDGTFEVIQVPLNGSRPIEVGSQDIFLTTSWWSTYSVLSTIPVERVVYLLQEDERMFYPHGDDRLKCSETMAYTNLATVINTKLLHTHLTTGDIAVAGLAARAIWFEPAVISAHTSKVQNEPRKLRLFFYSRPNNLRNLFWRGAEAICDAIERGIFNPDDWEFYFVGKDTPKFSLPKGAELHIVEGLDWHAYQNLVSTMDAAFVLMDTPHPSYPPLDMAAAGVAVLTNRHGIKVDLTSYSKNILIANIELESLREGLEKLATLASDTEMREKNRVNDGICRNWSTALASVVDELCAQIKVAKASNVS